MIYLGIAFAVIAYVCGTALMRSSARREAAWQKLSAAERKEVEARP